MYYYEAVDGCGNTGRGSLPAGTAEGCPGAVCVPHDQHPMTPGQTPGHDPSGPCPAIDDGQIHDATVCQ